MAAGLETLTGAIYPDEKAWALVELNLTPFKASKGARTFRPSKWSGVRRYQVVFVNRADRLAAHYRDLGPSESFDTEPFRLISLFEDSVAELQDMADDYRTKGDATVRQIVADAEGGSTLWKDFANQMDEAKAQSQNRSVFGPLVTKQRNSVSQQGIQRIKELAN